VPGSMARSRSSSLQARKWPDKSHHLTFSAKNTILFVGNSTHLAAVMAYKIDPIDRAIADLLIEDGRMSYAEIARRIGNITERSVRYRLDRLVKEGILRVSAVVNPKAIGLSVTADVLIEVEPGRVLEVARKMAEFECVSYVACSTGERDMSVQIVARNNEELYNFVTEVIAKVRGVRKTTTALLPLILKDVYTWSIPASACVAEEKK
jgi:Lrp/AsnC family transcriptional regulator, regulator for asnA, asnC and gidA